MYPVIAFDPHSLPLSYTATVNGQAVLMSQQGVFEDTFPRGTGTANIVITVSNGTQSAVQTYNLIVADNAPPIFLSSPPPGPAVVGSPYTYNILDTDPNGDAVTLSLTSGPAGMTLSGNTLSWTPTTPGTVNITLTATDAFGATATQTFTLIVASTEATNPIIEGKPPTTASIGQEYLFNVDAVDPNGYALTYILAPTYDANGNPTNSPDGMTIDNDGLIRWTPTSNQLGITPITVEVEDSQGGLATLTFNITVASQAQHDMPPIITSSPPNGSAVVGETYVYAAQATDPDNNPLSWDLEAGPTNASIDPMTGTLSWTPNASQLGPNTFTIRTFDPYGEQATQTFTLTARGINSPPVITSSPVTTVARSSAIPMPSAPLTPMATPSRTR